MCPSGVTYLGGRKGTVGDFVPNSYVVPAYLPAHAR